MAESKISFRTLNADEIDCRIATLGEKGLSLLLYKDARADMNLLDETVGAENWQRKHDVINNNLFCSVGIKVDGEWIWKQDVGTESYTEKEKGQASDSFKRACTNWGIGRELYDAPFIWVSADKVNIETNKAGKLTTNDRFEVSDIGYNENRKITNLEIINKKTGNVVYKMGQKIEAPKATPKESIAKAVEENAGNQKLTLAQQQLIQDLIQKNNITPEESKLDMANFGNKKFRDLTKIEADSYIKVLNQYDKVRAKREAQNGKA